MRPPIQLVIILALLFISPVASGQVSNGKIFTEVPVVQRQRFMERLNLYIDLLIKNNEPKLIELYDEETLCSLCKSKCSEDCAPPVVVEVPKGFRSVLLEFKPIKVSPYSSQGIWDYSIEVDQRERLSWTGKPTHIVKHKVRMFAVYQKGDWYFSPVSAPGMVYL